MTLTLDVAMLGPSGAGKTSLLTSLHAEFPAITRSTGLVLAAQNPTMSAELNRYRNDLERLGRQLVVKEAGVPGTRGLREHVFSLRNQGCHAGSHVDVRFTDYPGGWLTSPDSAGRDQDRLQQRLAETDILLIAVDTPALLTEDGRWHHDFNHPQRVRDQLTEWATKQRRLVVLVPLKCEAWTHDKTAAEELAGQVGKEYSEVLEGVHAVSHPPRVVVTPVHTVGSLVFKHYELHDGVPVARFQGRAPGLRYHPRWTGEPLRLVVQAALQRQQSGRSWWDRLGDFLTGSGHNLRVALDKLAAEPLGPSIDLSRP